MKKSSIPRLILMVLFAAVFVFSAYKLVETVSEYRQGEDHYSGLADSVVAVAPTAPAPTAGEAEPEKEKAPIAVDFAELLRQNEDVIGWIYCENTPINYPVLQSDDNDQYLRRLINGKRNTAGSIFMDYRSNADLSSRNTIVYGHNMRNNTMFGTLKGYNQQAYYEEHPILWFLTPNGDYKIELLAGYVTPDDSEAYHEFDTEEDLQEYMEDAIQRSTFETAADTENLDRIVTLSTCVRGMDTKRYVLVGSIIPV